MAQKKSDKTAEKKAVMQSEHLVLCVHGIGNQRPGDTVDDVLGGAVAEHNRVYKDSKIIADETIVTMFEDKYQSYADKLDDEDTQAYPGWRGTRIGPDGTPSPLPEKVKTYTHKLPKGDELKDQELVDNWPKREGVQKSFPLHIKRVRKQYEKNVETVMAEVYWADLSPEPKGAFATIFDLIKVVTSIGYLALDNAANVKARVGYQAVAVFLWSLVLGVVALNATLLMGVLVLMLEATSLFDLGKNTADADNIPFERVLAALAGITLILGAIANTTLLGKFGWTIFGRATELVMLVAAIGVFFTLPGAEAVIAATAVLTILFGRFIGRTRWDYSLWRMFSFSTGFWGLFLLVWMPFVNSESVIVANCAGETGPFCKTILSGAFGGEANQVFHFVRQLMLLLGAGWAVALVFCLLTYVAWFFDRAALPDSAPKKQQRRMYATICSALVLLWMIMASSFWVGIQHATKGMQTGIVAYHDCSFDGKKLAAVWGHCHEPPGILATAFENFISALTLPMGVAVAFFILLAVAGIYVVARRLMNKNVLYMMAESRPVIGRLLLNGLFQWVFALSTVGIFIVTVVFRIPKLEPSEGGAIDAIAMAVQPFLSLVPLFLLGLALLVYQMRDLVAGGLGAFRDIVVYANNNKIKRNAGSANFPPRQQIEGRFERICRFMIDQVQPRNITVVCHSQGTVVSTRNVRDLLDKGVFKTKDGQAINVTMVTMGSPVTHLYRKYFPRDFHIEPKDFPNVTWYNIGRTDDFVGTYIENLDAINAYDPEAPEKVLEYVPPERSKFNLFVPAGGHPGYFTDPYVWRHFSNEETINFKLVEPKEENENSQNDTTPTT